MLGTICLLQTPAKAYSESSQIPKMEIFVKTVNSWKPVTIFPNIFIVHVWLSSEYVSTLEQNIKSFYKGNYYYYVLNF